MGLADTPEAGDGSREGCHLDFIAGIVIAVVLLALLVSILVSPVAGALLTGGAGVLGLILLLIMGLVLGAQDKKEDR